MKTWKLFPNTSSGENEWNNFVQNWWNFACQTSPNRTNFTIFYVFKTIKKFRIFVNFDIWFFKILDRDIFNNFANVSWTFFLLLGSSFKTSWKHHNCYQILWGKRINYFSSKLIKICIPNITKSIKFYNISYSYGELICGSKWVPLELRKRYTSTHFLILNNCFSAHCSVMQTTVGHIGTPPFKDLHVWPSARSPLPPMSELMAPPYSSCLGGLVGAVWFFRGPPVLYIIRLLLVVFLLLLLLFFFVFS